MNPEQNSEQNSENTHTQIDVPFLFGLALKLLLQQIRKSPATVASRVLEYLRNQMSGGDAQPPSELPWLVRQALKYIVSEAKHRPISLLAYVLWQVLDTPCLNGETVEQSEQLANRNGFIQELRMDRDGLRAKLARCTCGAAEVK